MTKPPFHNRTPIRDIIASRRPYYLAHGPSLNFWEPCASRKYETGNA